MHRRPPARRPGMGLSRPTLKHIQNTRGAPERPETHRRAPNSIVERPVIAGLSGPRALCAPITTSRRSSARRIDQRLRFARAGRAGWEAAVLFERAAAFVVSTSTSDTSKCPRHGPGRGGQRRKRWTGPRSKRGRPEPPSTDDPLWARRSELLQPRSLWRERMSSSLLSCENWVDLLAPPQHGEHPPPEE